MDAEKDETDLIVKEICFSKQNSDMSELFKYKNFNIHKLLEIIQQKFTPRCFFSKVSDNILRHIINCANDFQSTDMYGNTLLHHICAFCSPTIIKYIINKKVININSKNNNNSIPIIIYAINNRRHSETEIMEILKFMVENGADINYSGAPGLTILFDFIRKNNSLMVKYCIELGADINKQANLYKN